MLWGVRQDQLDNVDLRVFRTMRTTREFLTAKEINKLIPMLRPHVSHMRRSLRKLRRHGLIEQNPAGLWRAK